MGTMPPDPPDGREAETDAAATRRRIAEIYDELAALPSDAFAARTALHDERSALTAVLREVERDDATMQRWADQAGARPTEWLRPVIVSPGEGGGA